MKFKEHIHVPKLMNLNLVPDVWITTHIPSLFHNSSDAGVFLINVCFQWLDKQSTNQGFIGKIKNRDVFFCQIQKNNYVPTEKWPQKDISHFSW